MLNALRVGELTPKLLFLGVFSIFLLVGCQQAPTGERFTSAKGVNIESFMSAETFMFVKAGTQDLSQLSNLSELNAYFPNDPLKTVVEEFNKAVREEADLDQNGLSYEEDILPILNEKTEFYFAAVPGPDDDKREARFVMAMTLADEGKLDSILRTQKDAGELKEENFNGQVYYTGSSADKSEAAHFVRVDDVFFVSTDLQLLKDGLSNLTDKVNHFAENPIYKKALNNYESSVLFVYADFNTLIEFLAQTEMEEAELRQSFEMMGMQNSDVFPIESEVITVRIEKEGIKVMVHVIGGEGVDFQKISGQVQPSYLLKQIPSEIPMLYMEGYNFRQTVDRLLEIASLGEEGVDPEFSEGIDDMKAFFLDQGVDLEKDVLPFLDRGYAFVFEDTKSLIPSMGLYVDVSGNVDGAVKVMNKIDLAFQDLWDDALQESPEVGMFVMKDDVIPEKLWKFSVNLNALVAGQSSALQKKLSGQSVEFYYGVLEENIMAFAVKSDLEQVYGERPVVNDDSELKKALSYLDGADEGVTYFSPNAVFQYLDRLLALAQEEGMPASELEEYNLVREYVLPIKSIVAASELSTSKISAHVFVHIAR